MMQSSATLIASLVYARFPAIDFPCLVDELDTALGGTGRWEGTTSAIFEVAGSRVVVGFEDHRRQPEDFRKLALGAAASMVLTIGPGPRPESEYEAESEAETETGPLSPLEPHRHVLLSALAERINRCFPCEFILWSETEEVFEPVDYAPLISMSAYCKSSMPSRQDMAVADVPRLRQDRQPPPPPITSLIRKLQALDLAASARTALPEAVPIAGPEAMPEAQREALLNLSAPHLSAPHPGPRQGTLVKPSRAFLDHQRAEFANSVPQIPAPQLTEMRAIRAALFAPVPTTGEVAQKSPLPQRLTIYSMNATLMLVALPVGSAILVYNMIRGEDLNLSARAIAATGTIVGLVQLLGHQGILSV